MDWNISGLSVKRGVTFGMAYLAVVGFGLFSLGRLQLDLYPDISFPMVMVITNYTGASPTDVETLISEPLEGALASVKNAKDISSTSKQGTSAVQVSFDWGYDMAQGETDVRRAIDMVKDFLPDDATAPMVFAFDPSMQPIVMMFITGNYPLDELRHLAQDDIKPRLERLPGIASVDVAGGLEREIHIELDPSKVAALGLDVNNIVGAVYRENLQVPGGSLDQGPLEFAIQPRGKYQRVEDIGEVVVGIKQDLTTQPPRATPVRLREVSQVKDSFIESQRVLEADGEPTVWLMVRKQSGSNSVRAAEAVVAALPEIKRELAADIDFKIMFNQAEFINLSLGNLSQTAIMGVFITFLVLLFFLWSGRSALIVATAIPISVIATFAVMDQIGITLNVLSMTGLALAIGMLVDNAIVVLENIFQKMEQGRKPWAAAIEGASTVGLAVTASTLTTVAVFVPILFVPGIAGVLFVDMAITICFSLLVSLLVAVTFIPLASSRLLGSPKLVAAIREASEGGRYVRFREWYGRRVDWALGHRALVMSALVGALVVTGLVATTLRTDFLKEDDQSIIFLSVETAVGSSLDEATQVLRDAVKVVESVVKPEERELVALDVGVGKGFVALFSKGVHAGMMRVRLVKAENRTRSQSEIEDAVREALGRMPGIKLTTGSPFSFGSGGDITVELHGHDLATARRIGLELENSFKAWPEMGDVTFSMEEQKPEVRVQFDRAKMAMVGLSTAAVGNAISAYFQGRVAGRYAEGGDEYDILVRYGKQHRLDLDELKRMPLVTPAGLTVPLANVAAIDVALGPTDITRMDQERYATVTLSLRDKYTDAEGKQQAKDLGTTLAKVEDTLNKYAWPDDFRYTIGGNAEDFQTSFRYLGLALLISILLVYIVMASLFESFRQPFVILFTVPMAAIGVIAAFGLTQVTMDMSALIGVIMLGGIVVNNGIVMVDAADQLRELGLGRSEAIAKAARTRLRPVLMTSLTTILAMVPLALGLGEGAAAWQGMAIAVIGGLVAATLLTLFFVPVIYTFFAPKVHVTLAERIAGSLDLPAPAPAAGAEAGQAAPPQ